jgi:hypothetical protein
VSDRLAERAFPPGALDVHVNPLLVAGAGGKVIDAILPHLDPAGRSHLAPRELWDVRHREIRDCHE